MTDWAEVMGQVHHLHHAGGTCGCSTPPDDPGGESDQDYRHRMATLGRDELVRMREAGLPVDLEVVEEVDLVALGVSVRPARLAEKLDQILGPEDTTGPPSPWTRSLALGQHELDHTRRQVHDHSRLREEGLGVDLDHDRLQLMGIDQTAPEAGYRSRPTIESSAREDATGEGRAGSAARGQPKGLDRNAKKTPMEKILAEGRDRIDFEDEE